MRHRGLSDRVVVVTGGGKGIGSGIALRLAQSGAHVVFSYLSNADRAREVLASIEDEGRKGASVRADLTRREDAELLMETAVETFGRIDALVNNAGMYPVAPLLEMTDEEWDRVIHVNLRAVFLCTQIAARQMVRQGEGGSIVNLASIETAHPLPLHAHYAAAKAGVVAFTRAAAAELGRHAVRVNAISPGLIRQEGLDEAWPEGVARFREKVPLGRLGSFEEVGDACVFLLSEAARWITGADLVVDGGVSSTTLF